MNSATNSPNVDQRPIIFFDGQCGTCHAVVRFILRVDPKHRFRFAPLQGSTAGVLIPEAFIDASGDTIIFRDEFGLYTRSDAVWRIFSRLGGIWSVIAFARYLPRGFREAVYRLIARNRHRFFTREDACRLPTQIEKSQFLP